uniref:RWP-RK domain-containing protein n=1 Tax=Aegilops tauschii subsp. strangulata TaxID=200361 RepID=A0A453CMI2_AEGTS
SYFPARNLNSLNNFKSTVPSEVISCLCSFMSEFHCCLSFCFLQNADSDLNLTDADLLAPAEKQRRAHREYIASITLNDIAQYFHLPIREASRTLKIGLSILKKKCRQYGIPRWPHRKLKSLDSLIHDLEYVIDDETERDGVKQEDHMQDEKENQDAIEALAKRKRMLETEKATIQQKPTLDLMAETKQFRQYVFKRKYRAKTLVSE